MAERNRPDDEAADDRSDEVFTDALTEDDDEPGAREGSTAVRSRAKADASDGSSKERTDSRRLGVLARIGAFFREVVAELRKVVWPTRKELLTYTAVVIAFLSVMTAIIVLLDLGFARAVLWTFGNSS